MNSLELEILEIVKVSFVSIFLIYACSLDIKSRVVPNRVWKAMLISVSPILVLQLYHNITMDPLPLLFSVFGVLFMLILSYFIYTIGAYGGADAKALMCLSVIFPLYPSIDPFPILNHGFGIFSFSILANSVIFTPFMIFAILLRNIFKEGFEGFFKNPLYYFAGYRISVEKIKFHNLFEFIDENGELRRVKRAIESDDNKLLLLKKAGIKEIWVTPALPFMIFITIGYFGALIFGDILVEIISLIFG
ncbi:MAG: A24 family peptidase C-terminal domain-containing protein [Archaeoglobaceae archaeon]|nr:prepilin peptidase [Archaeoglobaceae archaeon]MDW7990119.1 A24 family peptidase C-terminal domain-containing protein [Archaeoglobaceae archaeon]